jgi:hypothetical protein
MFFHFFVLHGGFRDTPKRVSGEQLVGQLLTSKERHRWQAIPRPERSIRLLRDFSVKEKKFAHSYTRALYSFLP